MRLHNLRHGFAVRALESFNAANRKDVGRHMLAVSTYMSHANVTDTYWYPEATPPLLLNTFLCVWLPRDRNASPHTIVSYTTSLNMLAVFAADRHSVATRNVRLAAVKSSMQTTEMYLRAEPFEKLETLKAWHPPGLRKGSFRWVQDELLAMLEAIKKG